MEQLTTIACPKCESDRVGSVEQLQGIAYVDGICEEGSLNYTGQTEIDWNNQKSQYREQNGVLQVLMGCWQCSHEWWMDLPKIKVDSDGCINGLPAEAQP